MPVNDQKMSKMNNLKLGELNKIVRNFLSAVLRFRQLSNIFASWHDIFVWQHWNNFRSIKHRNSMINSIRHQHVYRYARAQHCKYSKEEERKFYLSSDFMSFAFIALKSIFQSYVIGIDCCILVVALYYVRLRFSVRATFYLNWSKLTNMHEHEHVLSSSNGRFRTVNIIMLMWYQIDLLCCWKSNIVDYNI